MTIGYVEKSTNFFYKYDVKCDLCYPIIIRFFSSTLLEKCSWEYEPSYLDFDFTNAELHEDYMDILEIEEKSADFEDALSQCGMYTTVCE